LGRERTWCRNWLAARPIKLQGERGRFQGKLETRDGKESAESSGGLSPLPTIRKDGKTGPSWMEVGDPRGRTTRRC
jgi:hypothetical protein